MANEKIQIDIGAKDAASPVIEKLATKIDGLEADEARIVVTADTRKLVDQLDRARIKLGTLTGDEATVQARLVGTLEADVANAKDLLTKLDGQTATVKIDSVGARQNIDDLGKSADSSKSVLANMVGNATQDLGALGGVAGSAGVAIGQMGEYMADARASGEGWGSIVKNFGAMVGPIAAISAATFLASKAFQSIADTKAFDKKKAEDFAAAIEEVGDNARAVLDVIKDTQSITGRAGGIFGSGALEGTKDITKSLDAAGVSVDEFAAAVSDGGPALDAAVTKLEAMKTAAEEAFAQSPTDDAARDKIFEYADAIEILKETHKTYADQVGNDKSWANWVAGGDAAKATTDAWNAVLEGGVGILGKNTKAIDDNADAAKDAANRADTLADALSGITDEYDILSGRLDTSTSLINLAEDFDEVSAKAAESAKAIHEGSDDAQAKLYEQATAQNALKQSVIDTTKKLGEIPPSVVTEVSALIDRGSFAEAEELFRVLTRNRTMEISIITKGGIGFNDRLGGSRAF